MVPSVFWLCEHWRGWYNFCNAICGRCLIKIVRCSPMLTPMLAQYVVALCCLRHDPDAVDVTVGDLVLDIAANKHRDVDVTVTVREKDGVLDAFKAYEVKREGRPLDVAKVEQLCIKLRDMPNLTHRAIVSASNFTEAAVNKALANNVELFSVEPWSEMIEKQFPDFPSVGSPQDFFSSVESNLLYWVDEHLNIVVPDGPSSFIWELTTPLFTAKGKNHPKYENMGKLKEKFLMQSTEILFSLEPAKTLLRTFPTLLMRSQDFEAGPAWPHTHTIDVNGDKVFLKFGEKFHMLRLVTINGFLQWRRRRKIPEFIIIESVPKGKILAAAAIAEYGSEDGKMLAITFPPESRTLGIHSFNLSERHRNIIKGLKLRLEASNDRGMTDPPPTTSSENS